MSHKLDTIFEEDGLQDERGATLLMLNNPLLNKEASHPDEIRGISTVQETMLSSSNDDTELSVMDLSTKEVDRDDDKQDNNHDIKQAGQLLATTGDSEQTEINFDPLQVQIFFGDQEQYATQTELDEDFLILENRQALETSQNDQSDSEEERSENVTPDSESFHFFQPEEEPIMTPDFQEKALRSVSTAIFDTPSPTSYSIMTCPVNCEGCCTFDLCVSKNSKTPALSPESHAASKQGLTMMKKLLYPGLPKILIDISVLFELVLTITQFILGLVSLSLDSAQFFDIIYLIMAVIGLLLALLDSILHFLQSESYSKLTLFCKSKLKGKTSANIERAAASGSQNQQHKKCCYTVSKETREKIEEVFDFSRNIITDVILYPLLVLDLIDVITSQSLLAKSSEDKLNLSLFVIGVVFLVLSVYLVRIVMIVTAGLSLRRVPTNASHSHKAIVNMVLWFLVHVSAQILVHGSIFVSLGMNIYLENTEMEPFSTNMSSPTSTDSNDQFNSSFPLIYSCVTGLFVTLFGIFFFFIVNYYQLRELSVAFWVDMISLLQTESFAGMVFQAEGVKVAKQKAKGFAESIKLQNVKNDLKVIQSTPLHIKFLSPSRVPAFVILGILYVGLLVSFLYFLGTVCRPGKYTCQTFFAEPSLFAIPYFVTFVLVLIANAHIIILVGLWLAVATVAMLILILFVIFAAVNIPCGCVLFCINFVVDLGNEMNILAIPSD